MKRYAVFYYLIGPYGPVVSDRCEIYLCHAESADHACAQFFDSVGQGVVQMVMVEV